MQTYADVVIPALELLEDHIIEGQKAKVITDNDLYGTTLVKEKGQILNIRTGEPIPFSVELFKTKVKLMQDEKEVTLTLFLEAYKAGKKVKVETEETSRVLQKEELADELKNLPFFSEIFTFNQTDIMTMDELLYGQYYIVS